MPVLSPLLDILLPDDCPACGGLAGTGPTLLCSACDRRVPQRPKALETLPPLAVVWALAPDEGPLGTVVRRGKIRPDPWVMRQLGRRLTAAALGRMPRVDWICPVPSAPERKRKRGFEPAHQLAIPLSVGLNRPIWSHLRCIDRGKQAWRNRLERQQAAQHAFTAQTNLCGRVLLVDDVVTTGATLTACAQTLLKAGAQRVYGLAATCRGRWLSDFLDIA